MDMCSLPQPAVPRGAPKGSLRVLAALVVLVVLLPVGCSRKSKDVVIFRINGEDVFKSELDLLARNGMVKAGLEPGSAESQKWLKEHVGNLYDSLIKLYLIQQAAQATETEPSSEEIDRAVEQFKGVFPDAKEYAQFLEMAKLSPDQLRVIFRNKIMAERFQTAKMNEGKREPTQEELRKWYEEHADEFCAPNVLRLRHILFLVKRGASPEERIAVKDRAEEVRRNLAGADEKTFIRLAREISDDTPTAAQGGDLGFVTQQAARQTYPAGIAEAIFKLRKSEISPVIQSNLGYHIFMAVDDKQGFEEALSDVQARLLNDSMITAFSMWLAEARKKANIEILVQPQDAFAEPVS
jgi:parvulin-like peptidyl-prolyl isomerase